MDEIIYRTAQTADAEALSALFSSTFTEIFGHLYRPEDLAAFLSEQEPPHWARQITDPAFAIRVAERDGHRLGYLKLGPLKLPVDAPKPSMELHQLYLVDSARGAGVAAELMDWALREARARGAHDLYLSVFSENIRARRFYARYGSEEVGPYAFMVGEQADEDIILRLAL